MGNPFKDQFLKKGLVTKKQANKASHEQRLSGSKKKGTKIEQDDGVKKRLQQARNEQLARERELNRQQNEALKEKEIQGQIRQIIKQNQIKVEGDISYHFADGKMIQKIYADKNIVDALSKGQMAIVKQDEQYAVVPVKAAALIKDRNVEAVILLNSPKSKELDPDDPYAEFPIPDDYEW